MMPTETHRKGWTISEHPRHSYITRPGRAKIRCEDYNDAVALIDAIEGDAPLVRGSGLLARTWAALATLARRAA